MVVQLAGVVAEIELCGVAAKVRFREVMVGADHAALEDREEVFDRIGVLEAARGDIFAGAVRRCYGLGTRGQRGCRPGFRRS